MDEESLGLRVEGLGFVEFGFCLVCLGKDLEMRTCGSYRALRRPLALCTLFGLSCVCLSACFMGVTYRCALLVGLAHLYAQVVLLTFMLSAPFLGLRL